MKLRPKMAAIMLFAAMLVGTETGRTSAQDAPPDLRMLMNLDLFEPRANDAKGAPSPAARPGAPTDDSMLDQIRALDAMGYLGNRPEVVGAHAGGNHAPAEAPVPAQSSRPGYDVEGPQP